jgi:hypothetical protein
LTATKIFNSSRAMSYTNKEELLKLGEIDPELAAVRS